MTFEVVGMSTENAAIWKTALGIGDQNIVDIEISAAQILNMHVTPITLVAAPGAGKIIKMIWGQYFYKFVSSPYVGGDLPGIFYDHTNGSGQIDPNYIAGTYDGLAALFAFTEDGNCDVVPLTATSSRNIRATSVNANKPLVLTDDTPWTGGDGTVVAHIVYQVLDIPS